MKGVLKDKKVTGKKLIKSSASVFSNEMRWSLTQHVLHSIRTAAGTWRAHTGSTRPANSLSHVGQVALRWHWPGSLEGPKRTTDTNTHSWYDNRVHTKEYCWAHIYPTGKCQQSFDKGKYCPATYHEFRRCKGSRQAKTLQTWIFRKPLTKLPTKEYWRNVIRTKLGKGACCLLKAVSRKNVNLINLLTSTLSKEICESQFTVL